VKTRSHLAIAMADRTVRVLVGIGVALLVAGLVLIGWVQTLAGLAALVFAVALTPVLYLLLGAAGILFAVAWWLRRRRRKTAGP
jgi:apolipoprotein N-acyltransferase